MGRGARWRVVSGCGRMLAVMAAGMAGVVGAAESGRFVVPDGRGEVGAAFAYWDMFLADDAGYNFGFGNPPGLLGGDDESGNATTLIDGVRLTQTGTDTAFVTSTGAIYSFSAPTSFRVDYTVNAPEPVTSVVFQTLTGGRRLEMESIQLEYTAPGGEAVSLPPLLKALDDPQTGAFAERLVSAFQWDLSAHSVSTFRLVFGAPGSSMPLWEAQLDVVRGAAFTPELGYVLKKQAWPLVRFQSAGRVLPTVPAGTETRFFRPGTAVTLSAVPTSGFAHAGWLSDGLIREQASMEVVFLDDDVEVAAIFAPLSYATWRTHWFDHANAVLGRPADHLNDAVSGPTADPDGDGMDNFGEFAFGGDPYVADAAIRAGQAGWADGAPTLAYRQPASAAVAVDYLLLTSSDLKEWEAAAAVVVSKSLESSGYWRVTVRQALDENQSPSPFLRLEARPKS